MINSAIVFATTTAINFIYLYISSPREPKVFGELPILNGSTLPKVYDLGDRDDSFYTPYEGIYLGGNYRTQKFALYHEYGHYLDRHLMVPSSIFVPPTVMTGLFLYQAKRTLFSRADAFKFIFRNKIIAIASIITGSVIPFSFLERRADTVAAQMCSPGELIQAYDYFHFRRNDIWFPLDPHPPNKQRANKVAFYYKLKTGSPIPRDQF